MLGPIGGSLIVGTLLTGGFYTYKCYACKVVFSKAIEQGYEINAQNTPFGLFSIWRTPSEPTDYPPTAEINEQTTE